MDHESSDGVCRPEGSKETRNVLTVNRPRDTVPTNLKIETLEDVMTVEDGDVLRGDGLWLRESLDWRRER